MLQKSHSPDLPQREISKHIAKTKLTDFALGYSPNSTARRPRIEQELGNVGGTGQKFLSVLSWWCFQPYFTSPSLPQPPLQ